MNIKQLKMERDYYSNEILNPSWSEKDKKEFKRKLIEIDNILN